MKTRSDLHAKLEVNDPGDAYEQEADRIADQVLSGPEHPGATRDQPRIRRRTGPSGRPTEVEPTGVEQALAGPGRPLERALRQDMERRFGRDFSGVRVHADAPAEQSARDVHAHAYTVGQDIVFAAGRYAPGTQDGRRLIAHELTHVVQSGESSSPIHQATLHRSPDDAQIEAEIQLLRMQLMVPVNPLRPMQEARLIQLEAMRNRGGGGASHPGPAKPGPVPDSPFVLRFWEAYKRAKAAALQKVYRADKAYYDSSITRGLMKHVEDLAPGADEVWKAGIDGGLFRSDEKDRVEELAAKWASESFDKRYSAAKYGRIHGDEAYYEEGDRRRDDPSEIWRRGRLYGLFLPGDKAVVLNISPYSIYRAAVLNAMARQTEPKTRAADKLLDEIHNFTSDEGVVLLGPEIGKLFGPDDGYEYRDEADRGFAADEINKAYEKSLGRRCLLDPDASVAARWDESLRKQGLGPNNLEVDHYNSKCFYSRAEYDAESRRRYEKYGEDKQKCESEKGLKWPSLSRKVPDWIVCEDRVEAEYHPTGFARLDAQRIQANAQLQKIDDVVNSGAFATLGRLAGYAAAKIAGRDDDVALAWSEQTAALGGLGDVWLGLKAGMTARATSQNYQEGGGLVVSGDAQVTLTFKPSTAVDPPNRDPWAGAAPGPEDATGAKATALAASQMVPLRSSNAPRDESDIDTAGNTKRNRQISRPFNAKDPRGRGPYGSAPKRQAPQKLRINLAYVNSAGELTTEGITFLRSKFPSKFGGLNDQQVRTTFESDIKGTMWEKMVLDEIARTVPTPPRGKAGQGQPFLMKNNSLANMVAELEKKVPGSVRNKAPLGMTVRQLIESSPELKKAVAELERNPNEAVRNEWVDWIEKNQDSLVGDKKPDVVEVIPDRELAVVYDPTLTVNSPFGPAHAFKTALYREALLRITSLDIGAMDIGLGILNLVGE